MFASTVAGALPPLLHNGLVLLFKWTSVVCVVPSFTTPMSRTVLWCFHILNNLNIKFHNPVNRHSSCGALY